jgi:sugar-specific transcriptional regulator TrmB
MEIVEVLESLGFDDREISIYLTLLKRKNMSALEISRDSKIDRTTTYDILEKMSNKGFVSSIIINNVKHFNAIKPKDLLNIFLQKCNSLENILPKLNSLEDSNYPVEVQMFQGKKGILSILKQLISSKSNYRVIGINKQFEDIIGYYNEQGLIQIDKWNVKEQAIVDKKSKFKKAKKGEYRYVEGINFPITTLLFANKVVFIIWQEPYFAIFIESEQFSKAQNRYFELLWNLK